MQRSCTVKKLWVSDGRISATANVHCNQATLSGLHQNEEEGWALKSIKKNKPFSDKQKKFLEEKLVIWGARKSETLFVSFVG